MYIDGPISVFGRKLHLRWRRCSCPV